MNCLIDPCLAMKVGVPVVPGTPGPVAHFKDAAKFIEEHGFPSKCARGLHLHLLSPR